MAGVMGKKKKKKDEDRYDVVVTDDHASAGCWCGSEISGPIALVEKFLKLHRHENPRNEPAGFRV